MWHLWLWLCSVQWLSCVWLFVTQRTVARQASLSITNCWSLLKLLSIESATSSNQLIFCHPLLFPPSIFPSIRVFSNESVLHIRWKSWLKAQHSENEDHGIWSHHFMGTRWGNRGNSVRLYFGGGAQKSLQMVIAAMKLKDPYSLEGKLWPT